MRARFVAVPTVLLAVLIGCGPKPGDPATSDPDTFALAKKRLRAVAFGIHNYQDAEGGPLPGVGKRVSGALSWRVEILPYMDQKALYEQFHLDEPWDSAHNKTLIDKMPVEFASAGKAAPPGHTYLRSFVGPHAFIPPPPADPKKKREHRALSYSFPDDTRVTLAVAEAAEPVVWTKPDELAFDGGPDSPDAPLPKLGGPFPDGFFGALVDGQVLFFPNNLTDATLLRSLITIDGNDFVNYDPVLKANGVPETEWQYRRPQPKQTPAGSDPKR